MKPYLWLSRIKLEISTTIFLYSRKRLFYDWWKSTNTTLATPILLSETEMKQMMSRFIAVIQWS
jgi:hypothetical protein